VEGARGGRGGRAQWKCGGAGVDGLRSRGPPSQWETPYGQTGRIMGGGLERGPGGPIGEKEMNLGLGKQLRMEAL